MNMIFKCLKFGKHFLGQRRDICRPTMLPPLPLTYPTHPPPEASSAQVFIEWNSPQASSIGPVLSDRIQNLTLNPVMERANPNRLLAAAEQLRVLAG